MLCHRERVCLLLFLLLSVCATSHAQTVSITSPAARVMFQHSSGVADIAVSASASGVPSGGGVEFVLDMGTVSQRSSKDYSSPYSYTFAAAPLGEHTLDVYVVNSSGARLSAHASVSRVGVGDIIVCVGDSITAGEYDDIDSDNWSADGRNGPFWDSQDQKWYGGYEPILNDLLTTARGYPHSVVNEGLPSESTDKNPDGTPGGGKVRIAEVIARNSTARTWLVAYGTNDANQHMAASTYKSNLESIIGQIQSAIPGAKVHLPKIFYFREDDPQGDQQFIPAYHNSIGDLTRGTSNVYWGADLQTLFKGNHSRYDHTTGATGTWLSPHGTHHPNGIGVQKMAMLWKMALLDRAILVGDGVVSSFGGTYADKVHVDRANSVGLSGSNLLQVCEVPRESIVPPTDMSVVGGLGYDLRLTGGSDFSSALDVTLRVEATDLAAAGASSWEQAWIAADSSVLPTERLTDPDVPADRDLKASTLHRALVYASASVNTPVTTCVSSPPVQDGENGWFITVPQITLTATGGAGAVSTKYHWDSNSDVTYTGPFTAPLGTHTLRYHSVDQYGNTEPTKSRAFKVDNTPPDLPTISDGGKYCVPGVPMVVSWTASRDPESGINKYKYAIGTTPGGIEIQAWTSTTSTSFTWTPPAATGQTYYFSVMAKNLAGIYAAPVTSDGITVPLEVESIGLAKKLPENTLVLIRNVIVTASYPGLAYVEEADRSAGIAVACPSPPARGSQVTVMGLTRSQAIAPILISAEMKNAVPGIVPDPLGIRGSTLKANAAGEAEKLGLKTSGLLVRMWGVVGQVGTDWMWVWDASNTYNYVSCGRLTTIPEVGNWIVLTGISTSVDLAGTWLGAIEPRDQADVTIIGPWTP